MAEDEQDPREQYANWKAPELSSSGVIDFASAKAKQIDRTQESAEFSRKKELLAAQVKIGLQAATDRRRKIDKLWEENDPSSYNDPQSVASREDYYRFGEQFLTEALRLISTSSDLEDLQATEAAYLDHVKQLEAGAEVMEGRLGIPSKKTLEEIGKLPPDVASIIRASIEEGKKKRQF